MFSNMRFLFVIAITCVTASNLCAQKLSLGEIIEKHLTAIGTSEKRAQNRMIGGNCNFKTILSGNKISRDGKLGLTSDGTKLLLLIAFPDREYNLEKVGFDGTAFGIGTLASGARPPIAGFIYKYPEVFVEGIYGGSLSSAWILNRPLDKKSNLKLEGSKKVNGKDSYVISYEPKKKSLTTIKLFIDKETFLHVRTEYFKNMKLDLPVMDSGSNLDLVANQTEKLTEDFSGFSNENGLMLPHSYQIEIETNLPERVVAYQWTATLSTFFFDQKIDPAVFAVDQKK